MTKLGMPASEILALPGYSGRHAVRSPEKWGSDESGLFVKWFYVDVAITLKRFHHEGGSSYRVSVIEPYPIISECGPPCVWDGGTADD